MLRPNPLSHLGSPSAVGHSRQPQESSAGRAVATNHTFAQGVFGLGREEQAAAASPAEEEGKDIASSSSVDCAKSD